jgi:DNA-binding response OmpR family regulator
LSHFTLRSVNEIQRAYPNENDPICADRSVNYLQSSISRKSMIIDATMTISVLTIDDDTAITELLSIILKTYDFEPFIANSGEEGIRIIQEKSPQIVLLDLMMPRMDGWQVCRAIREFSSVPILILSALNDSSIVASILDIGADDYLVKPVPSAELVAHLNKLARRTGGRPAPIKQSPAWRPETNPFTS